MYCSVICATSISRMSRFWRRIRYSSRSSGPSKASRNTSSACGGMYRSLGSSVTASPRTIAKGISPCSGRSAGIPVSAAGFSGSLAAPSSGAFSAGFVTGKLYPQAASKSLTSPTPRRKMSGAGPVKSTTLVASSPQKPPSITRSTSCSS